MSGRKAWRGFGHKLQTRTQRELEIIRFQRARLLWQRYLQPIWRWLSHLQAVQWILQALGLWGIISGIMVSAALAAWSVVIGWPGPIIVVVTLYGFGAALLVSAMITLNRRIRNPPREYLAERLKIQDEVRGELERWKQQAQRHNTAKELGRLKKMGEELLKQLPLYSPPYTDYSAVRIYQQQKTDVDIWVRRTYKIINRLDPDDASEFSNCPDEALRAVMACHIERLTAIIARAQASETEGSERPTI